MEQEDRNEAVASRLRDLYPTLTPDELQIAEANFRRYLEIVMSIQNGPPLESGGFDIGPAPGTMKERSNGSLKT
jgi:hypothetical protein